MGQRNYVAKYAQRSGAGRHTNRKEKKMSYAYQEDWVHIDEHNTAVEGMQERIKELEEAVENAAYDEAFILSELIELRWRYSDYKDMYKELEAVIGMHSEPVIRRAIKMLAEKFPSKATAERWEIEWLRG